MDKMHIRDGLNYKKHTNIIKEYRKIRVKFWLMRNKICKYHNHPNKKRIEKLLVCIFIVII